MGVRIPTAGLEGDVDSVFKIGPGRRGAGRETGSPVALERERPTEKKSFSVPSERRETGDTREKRTADEKKKVSILGEDFKR